MENKINKIQEASYKAMIEYGPQTAEQLVVVLDSFKTIPADNIRAALREDSRFIKDDSGRYHLTGDAV